MSNDFLSMGEHFELIQCFVYELQDSVDSMKASSENEDIKTKESRERKETLLMEARYALKQMKLQYNQAHVEGDDDDSYRICTTCEDVMTQGFCIESGEAYYCSEKCRTEDGMTQEDFDKLYDDGEGDSYWTDWEIQLAVYFRAKKDKEETNNAEQKTLVDSK